MHYSNLRKEDLQPVVDKIIKRIAGWRGRLLSYGGKLVLIRACLASIPIYLLSVIKFPKCAVRLINSQMSHCFWNNYEGHHKYHLAKWGLVCQKKDFGGLGIPNLRDLNLCLLASWVWRYSRDDDKLWKQIIDFKYNTMNPNIFPCPVEQASPFWKGVLWAAKATKMGYQWRIGKGNKIRFWENHCLGLLTRLFSTSTFI